MKDRIVGHVLVAVAPTGFWTAMLDMMATALEYPLSASLEAAFATVIYSFLTVVWSLLRHTAD